MIVPVSSLATNTYRLSILIPVKIKDRHAGAMENEGSTL